MREFFNGWRRKAGVVLLVMACAEMGGWIRSNIACDEIYVRNSQGDVRSLASASGWLHCSLLSYEGDHPPPPECGWNSVAASSFLRGLGCSDYGLSVPYWLALSLTLLSALLLLLSQWKGSP